MMDFQIIGHNSSGYYIEDIIDGWSSLIWTERYLEADDFELRSSNIEKVLNILDLNTLVTQSETNRVMMVETIEVQASNDNPEIVVTGRSLETLLESRSMKQDNEKPKLHYNFHPDGWALRLITSALVYGQTYDTRDALPHLVTSDTTSSPGTAKWWRIKSGDVYSVVTKVLQKVNCGLKTYYHKPDTSGNFTIDVNVYEGLDRTLKQTQNPYVVFRQDEGHVDDIHFLRSNKGYMNIADVVTPLRFARASLQSADSESPLGRRVLQIEDSSMDSVGDSGLAPITAVSQVGFRELVKHPKTKLLSAKIGTNVPFKLGVDYNIGDKVTIEGSYGISGTLFIDEYIFSQNKDGYVAYPTFKEVPDRSEVL